MKYLCFDIECCDGRHICEFGYVVIDEDFNVVARDCITINPEHKFRLAGRGQESDVKLAFTEEQYYASPKFPAVYDKIKSIITQKDCKIVGFSMNNDSGFLATAYEKYGLEPVRFQFLDFQKLYRAYSKSKDFASVSKMVEQLGIENIVFHKSDDDSFAVLKALEIICKREGLSIEETLELLKKLNGNYQAEISKTQKEALRERAFSGKEKAQKEYLQDFIKKLKKNPNKTSHEFSGKTVCISATFQKKRFAEALVIIEKIYAVGGKYSGKAGECDIFINYASKGFDDRRFLAVKNVIKSGKSIKVLTLKQALTALKITSEDLKEYFKN